MKRLARIAGLCLLMADARLLHAAETSGVAEGTGEVFARAKAELNHAVKDGRIAGGVHLVVRDGKTLYSEAAGFGDIPEQTLFTADSILRIYSMTKPITSVAAMRLFEQGKFGLDDPVARFIPAFTNATVLETVDGKPRQVPPQRPITVRDVLRHTTGYSYGDEASVREFYEREGFLTAGLLIMPLICGGNLRVIGQESQTVVSTYRTETNILYRAETDLTDYARERCRLDLYYPTDQTDFATVVWFHGGGLTGGDRSIPGSLRGKGIAVVAAGYRLSPHVKSPAYVEDAAAAVAWTFHNIGKYGGSTNRIFVSGHSAGGYLTSMVGLDRRWLAAHSIEANRIAGLVPLSPQAITHFTIRAERGVSDQQPVVDDLAPLFHVRKDAPPILLVTGDREKELLGRYEENAYFWRMLKVVGHPDAELIELKGYDHGQMAEPAFPLLLRFIEKHSLASADRPIESAHWNQFRSPNGQGVEHLYAFGP